MAIESLLQPLLIQEVSNESDAATEDEESIQCSILDNVLSLIFCEEAAGKQGNYLHKNIH